MTATTAAAAGTSGAAGDGRFEVADVTVRFGGLVALDGVGLTIEPHQVHGVIGPNGAGKTTLFNVCCGFLTPDEGTLRWRGQAVQGLRPHKLAGMGIARTLQGVGLFQNMTVLENVMAGAKARAKAGFVSGLLGLPSSDRDEDRLRAESMEALSEVGAAAYAPRYPSMLPYPVQKRVALARALVNRPSLLMLDEPAAGLSHDDMGELGETIRRLSASMAVMLVEHHMDLVMSVCDQITVLDFGRRIAVGTPSEVRNDPAVLAAYLGDEVDADTARPADAATAEGA